MKKYALMSEGVTTHTGVFDKVAFKTCSSTHLLLLAVSYLKFCCNIASLIVFCWYIHADCSSQLANCKPPPPPWPHCTLLSIFAHPCTVLIAYARVKTGSSFCFSFCWYILEQPSFVYNSCLCFDLFQEVSTPLPQKLTYILASYSVYFYWSTA